VHAAGGDCAGVVIVDGLWGAWRTPKQEIDALYATIRAVADDPGATAPAPPAGLDPRTTYGYGLMAGPDFARRFWNAITMPVLAIETPASHTPVDERAERLSWFGGPTDLVMLERDDPTDVVAAIKAWRN
jgi:hypothetical protein